MQIPHADEGQICPLHKVDTSTVCHRCPWWTRIVGKHPQTDETLDQWACAVALLPILLIENAQQARATGAAVESFRNNMVEGVMEAIDTAARGAQRRLNASGTQRN
jgi:hypothetical protein